VQVLAFRRSMLSIFSGHFCSGEVLSLKMKQTRRQIPECLISPIGCAGRNIVWNRLSIFRFELKVKNLHDCHKEVKCRFRESLLTNTSAPSIYNIQICDFTWDSSVGIVKVYRVDGQDFLLPAVARFFLSSHHPDRLWGPPSPLWNGY
jgi:hypothetical protein